MKEPRPATMSARPCESRSACNYWKTRTGSAALSTVTALASRIAAFGTRRLRGSLSVRNRGTHAGCVPRYQYIETDLVSQRNRFEQIAEMFRGVDRPVRDSVNGCCDETVYANFHGFLVLVFKTTARLGYRRL